MRSFIFKVFLLIGFISVFTGCVDEDDNSNVINGPTALDFLVDSPNHSILIEALTRTQLEQNIDNSGSFTLFAPTDAAFNVFLQANGFGSVNAIPEDELRTLLLYHLQSEVRLVDQFNSQYYKTQASIDTSQMDAFVSLTSNALQINNRATVTLPDNRVSNGVVHVVDQVLELPSVVTLLAANPNFSNLVTALNQEGLSIVLADNADASAPFTVFAPSNAGFTALIVFDPNDNLNNFQDVLNQNNLDDKLLYHILGSQRLRLEDFESGVTINPLGTGNFAIDTTAGFTILDGSGTTTNLVATNITAFNGVIHQLDFVLRQN
ncbi:fasciclin domain-containing protein [Nonlabens marinus]|uniref:Transforming growth factor-beta induced protein IG-H3 n=1 Tax=Nonlabens marinus S1-08 TaxID=1454201 RepID=W8VZ68_9FLAO|nr:fasciclin domain-containing protein [Nonlabens marinus]BAO54051.1 transforming growth factor-beta induced protein IG-H3 precursor [Nonlabens marinus S1-08]